MQCRMCVRCALITAGGASLCGLGTGRILRVSRWRASETKHEAESTAPLTHETRLIGAEIYFRAQVFHTICTSLRQVFHRCLLKTTDGDWRFKLLAIDVDGIGIVAMTASCSVGLMPTLPPLLRLR